MIRPPRLRGSQRVWLAVFALLAAQFVAGPAQAAGCTPAGGQRMPTPPTVTGDFVFSGHGWGHGIGMSQWGAQGAAKLGCSVDDILTTYYPGVQVTSASMPDRIRVGIVPNRPNGSLVMTYDVQVTAGTATWTLRDIDPETGEVVPTQATQPAGSTWQVQVQTDGSFIVRDVAKMAAAAAIPPPDVTPTPDPTPGEPDPQDPPTTDQSIVLEGGDGLSALRMSIGSATVRLPRELHTYRRGALEFFPRKPDATADGMYVTLAISDTSNVSAMDAYLYGLAEVPSSWEPAALQAQAVVGRSFALAQWQAYRGNRTDCRCDLFDTTSSQHYTAYDKEGEATFGKRWVAAVAATSRQVMQVGGSTAVGFYASSHGGHSDTNVFVWGGSELSYLRPVDDSRWDLASGNPNAAWSVAFSAAQLREKFKAAGIDVGAVQSVTLPAPRGASGRVGDPSRGAGGVLIQGSKGTARIAGNLLRTALELRSTLVEVRSNQVSCAPPSDIDLKALRPDRLAGVDRIATAAALSQTGWPEGSEVAVLAAAGDFPDALAGGPLAARNDAPLLLTSSDALDDTTARELQRLKAGTVLLLGGTNALSQRVEDQITAMGIASARVAGPDRWSTAAAAAQRIGVAPGGEILLALGRHPEPIRAWPDAVASGALQAGGEPLPLLLTAGDALPAQTRLALEQLRAQGAGRVLIFGGTGAIGTAVEEQVATLGLQTQRVAGVNRFATSTAAVQAARSRGANDNAVMVARADAYPDALSAAALAARTSTPLLLVDSCDLVLREATAQWFEANPGLTQARVIGGPKAVSERVRWQLDTRLTP